MINKITYTFFIFFFLFLCGIINAQDLKVIDNKGTIKSINKVTYGKVVPTATNPAEKLKGDIYIKGTTALGSTTTPEETYLFDGTTWMKIGSNSHTGTKGSVFFADTNGTPTENNAHLFWDNVNERLNIGNVLAGTNKLTVNGSIRSRAFNNANGTVGLPSYRFSSDPDTGMWRGSTPANHLRFSTKGIEALTINASQNIGIGTDSPTEKLDVNGKLRVRTITEETALTATDRIPFVTTDGVFKKITPENLGNASFWTLKGNSGIDPAINFLGTTDAQALVLKTNNVKKLEIHATKGQVLINQATTYNSHPFIIRANGSDVLAFQNSSGVTKWHWNLLGNGLNFVESGVLDYRLFLQNGGNVGIGTNLPTQKLDVNGKLKIRVVEDITTTGLLAGDKTLIIGNDNVVKKIALPQIIATGNVNENGTCECSAGVSTQYTAAGKYYYIDSFGTGKYTIQLTLEAPATNQWDRQIYYYDKSIGNFKVKMTDKLQGSGGSDKRKMGVFSFVITRIP